MKIRNGLVSNSSSSSFLLNGLTNSEKEVREMFTRTIEAYNHAHPNKPTSEEESLAFITSTESDHCPKCDHHTVTIEVAMMERAPSALISMLRDVFNVSPSRSRY